MTNYTISKTGVDSLGRASDFSTDAAGVSTVAIPVSMAKDLSLQIGGAGAYAVATSVSNDGINYISYSRFLSAVGAATPATIAATGLYLKPNGDYFTYLKVVITGVDATFLLTVNGN